jgi:hypothetical protein
MAVEYKWTLGSVQGKREFTDKNGNKRNNVIKSVELVFQGKKEGEDAVIKESALVVFDLVDLTSFEEVEDLTQEIILNWALNKLHPKQKIDIENNIKSHFGEHESNLIQIEINE